MVTSSVYICTFIALIPPHTKVPMPDLYHASMGDHYIAVGIELAHVNLIVHNRGTS